MMSQKTISYVDYVNDDTWKGQYVWIDVTSAPMGLRLLIMSRNLLLAKRQPFCQECDGFGGGIDGPCQKCKGSGRRKE